MPELPEVEAVAAVLREEILGETIDAVDIRWAKWAANLTPTVMGQKLHGQTLSQIHRRAKHLVFIFEDGAQLWSHLRMTGRWLVDPAADDFAKHCSAVVRFRSGRTLAFVDVRKFGRAAWYAPGATAAESCALGPEPLDPMLTSSELIEMFQTRSRDLKALLLDQSFIAGLGNIYVSEILHRARINPFLRSDQLTRPQIRRFHSAMVAILNQAIAERGTTVFDYRGARNQEGNFQHFLQVYQRHGCPCPACQTPILRAVQGQRATFFCPQCQQVSASEVARLVADQVARRQRTSTSPTL